MNHLPIRSLNAIREKRLNAMDARELPACSDEVSQEFAIGNPLHIASGYEPEVGSFLTSGEDLLNQLTEYTAKMERKIAEQQARITYLETLTITDDLTGVYNRRGFEEVLKRTLQSARRYGETGCLLYVDLNKFKCVNDTFGHMVGDMVLRKTAQVLLEEVRQTDAIARLGGDEFAVLLTRCDRSGGRERASRIERSLNNSSVEIRVSQPGLLFEEVREIPISASFGRAEYDAETRIEDLLSDADRAMYQNKQGRDTGRAAAKL